MRTVQKLVWVVFTVATLILEFLFRVCLFPLGICITIVACILGMKRWINNSKFLIYCTPWNMDGKYFVLSNVISNWFDPTYHG